MYDDGYTDSHVRPMMVRRMTNGESSTPSDPNAAWREWRERRRQRRGQGRSSSSSRRPPPRGSDAAARQLLQVHQQHADLLQWLMIASFVHLVCFICSIVVFVLNDLT